MTSISGNAGDAMATASGTEPSGKPHFHISQTKFCKTLGQFSFPNNSTRPQSSTSENKLTSLLGNTGEKLTIISPTEPSGKPQLPFPQNQNCNEFRQSSFPNNSSRPQSSTSDNKLTPFPGKSPEAAATQGADPIEKNSIKFLVQWMQRGGADPVGKNALKYPSNIAVALEKLHHLATSLVIDPLIARTSRDLAAMRATISPLPAPNPAVRPVVRPKVCFLCGAPG